MNPVDLLKAVLCGQDGKCSIAGSEADRKVVDEALAALDTAQPERAPLSDAEIDEIWRIHLHRDSRVRAIEAAHGIKQGGQQ